ncbi:MAG TPA: hypothetical protein VHR88_07360 [Solirubrobacteraceae bacterium]|jgi:hypothetical protein|nr:hypothetical protein [Solirubrobacteraceae bacterium]
MGKRSRRKAKDGEAPAAGGEGPAISEAPGAEAANAAEEGKAEAPFPAGDVNDLRDLYAITDRMALLYHLYRWTLLTGELPEPEDWQRRDDWPHPNWVDDVFGSWDAMLDASGVDDARLLSMYDEQEKKLKEARRRADEATARARALAREESREPELRRQIDVAKRKREEAEDARSAAEAAAARAAGELTAQRSRAEAAEQRLAEGAEPQAAEDPELARLRAELDAAQREVASMRGEQERLVSSLEVARDDRDTARQTLRRVQAELAARGGDGEAAAPEDGDDGEPANVLDAVHRAARDAQHLVFAESAYESAEESPFRHPARLYETLMRLDELAALYARPEGFGQSLGQAANELGLNWRADVSDLARGRWPDHYRFTYAGRELWMGPHVALGSGSGANNIARIYLHVADGDDGLDRGLIVAAVGRKKPDTTT